MKTRAYALKPSESAPQYTYSPEEVLLRGGLPKNVIPFHEYVTRRNIELAQFGGGHAKSEFATGLLNRLYRQFVAPYFPTPVKRGHRTVFIKHTIPYLMEATCKDATYILSSMFYHRNAVALRSVSKGQHMQECAVAISQVPAFETTHKLRTERQRDALRIVTALSCHDGGKDAQEGCFYLAARDLQARLLLPDHKTALRILDRFCEIGILRRVETGKVRWESLKAGEKPTANVYRLVEPRS